MVARFGTLVVFIAVVSSCTKSGADARRQQAARQEDEIRRDGQAVSLATRGESAEVLVLKNVGDCDDQTIERLAMDPRNVQVGFKRVECESAGKVVGADLPYVRSGKTEVERRLKALGNRAKRIYMETSMLPAGPAGPTPTEKCCSAADHRCPVTQKWARSDIWTALDFQIDEPSRFQYSYECSRRAGEFCVDARISAVGDLDCDGTAITYALDITTRDGNVALNLTEPPPNSD